MTTTATRVTMMLAGALAILASPASQIPTACAERGLERGKDYWMPLLPAIGVLWEF